MLEKNTSDDDFEKFEFVRVFTPQHIPTYLVEQVKDRDYSVEQFYSYQEINCVRSTENGPVLNPLNLLYVIVNKKKVTKGYCWMVIDPLTKDLIINTYSISPEYWNKGKAVKLLQDKVKEIIKDCSLNKVYWITKCPKHSERYGFKQSRHVLMEYLEDKNGSDIKGVSDRSSKPFDSTAESVHQQSAS